jgi:hypothetical protein
MRWLVVAGLAAAFVWRRPSAPLACASCWLLGLWSLPLLWSHYLVLGPALLAPVWVDETASTACRYWGLATLASLGLFAAVNPPTLLGGALVLANLVACLLVACWRSPARRAATPRPR